jgi:long-chain acyl-CoA synthetase
LAQPAAALSPAADTFPKLLLQHARVRPDGVAIREKDLGIWQSWSWSQVADEVHALACGLAAQGFGRGMNLAIIGDNRPRLYWSFAAAQSLGGVPVPLYQDSVSQEMLYVLENAEIEYAIVEDQEQVDKLLEILPQYPKLKHIYYDDRGAAQLHQPQLMAYEERIGLSTTAHPILPRAVEGPEDTASCSTPRGLPASPRGSAYPRGIRRGRGDVVRRFTPTKCFPTCRWPGWDHLFSYGQAMVAGFTVNCPESSEPGEPAVPCLHEGGAALRGGDHGRQACGAR